LANIDACADLEWNTPLAFDTWMASTLTPRVSTLKLRQSAVVDPTMCQALARRLPLLRSLYISVPEERWQSTVDAVAAHLPLLHSLALECATWSDSFSLVPLQCLPQLRHLRLQRDYDCDSLTHAQTVQLRQLASLRELDIEPALTSHEFLHLITTSATAAAEDDPPSECAEAADEPPPSATSSSPSSLSPFVWRWTRLGKLDGLHEDEVERLADIQSLTHVRVTDMLGGALGFAPRLPLLTTLHFTFYNSRETYVSSRAVLRNLQACTRLTTLSMEGGHGSCALQFSDEELANTLACLPALRSFALEPGRSAHALLSLHFLRAGSLPSTLTSLSLSGFEPEHRLSPTALVNLLELRALHHLHLSAHLMQGMESTVARLRPPSKRMPSLRRLSLR
jgi:hypothetical protein